MAVSTIPYKGIVNSIYLRKKITLGSHESGTITFSSSEITDALHGHNLYAVAPTVPIVGYGINFTGWNWTTPLADPEVQPVGDYSCNVTLPGTGGNVTVSVVLIIFYR